MTPPYALQLICFALMPLSLLTGQGLFIGPLALIAYLIHQQALQRQQIDFLLQQATVNDLRRAAPPMPTRPKPLGQMKGVL